MGGRILENKKASRMVWAVPPTCDVASVHAYRAAVLLSNLKVLFQAGVHQVYVVLIDLDLRSGLAVPVEVQLDSTLLVV